MILKSLQLKWSKLRLSLVLARNLLRNLVREARVEVDQNPLNVKDLVPDQNLLVLDLVLGLDQNLLSVVALEVDQNLPNVAALDLVLVPALVLDPEVTEDLAEDVLVQEAEVDVLVQEVEVDVLVQEVEVVSLINHWKELKFMLVILVSELVILI